MRQISRIQFVLLVTFLSFGMATALRAQSGSKTGKAQIQSAANNKGSKPSPPKLAPADDSPKPTGDKTKAYPAELIPEEVTPEIEELLKTWEAKSSKIKSLHGKQTRSEFNTVFKVEKISLGRFFLETPDKGRIDMLAVKNLKKGAVSSRKDAEGTPYSLETGQSERWICTGDAIVMINEDEKTYQRDEIPESERGKNIVHSPLPFLFGMKADEAKTRFKLKIIREQKDEVQILVIPLMEKDLQNYEKAIVVLDKKNYLPKTVRLRDQSNLEIVYKFEEVVINDSDIKSKFKTLFGIDDDPYHPSLKPYKLVMQPAAAPADEPTKPIVPASGKLPAPPKNASKAPQSGTKPSSGKGQPSKNSSNGN